MPRTTELENAISNTGLCQKRDQIVDLFDKLLERLIDEAVLFRWACALLR